MAEQKENKQSSHSPEPRPLPRVIEVAELFRGAREIRLCHGHEEYRLRLTRADKLILTK